MRADLQEPIRIREEELASALGVSRTPVREALIRLEGTGMVNLRPGRGALLMPVTDRDYAEWLQIREQLEGVATREAALNASRRDVERLREIFAPFLDGSADGTGAAAYSRANVEFHQQIMHLAGNELLRRVWMSFDHVQTSYRRQTIAKLHRSADSLREHLEIIEAIEHRDADRAEALAKGHVRSLANAVKQAHATKN
ncbi:GntR family transcriptional regulator [Achromobacter spanius]|uniref:GntR family transcriptional regulator n=1 Tax=Achromobacter spanius TaxID=217203 RepID=UPI0036E21546